MTLAGVLVLLAACFIGGLFAQTNCITDGWFGPNCQYQCHCVNSAPCDKDDGSCSLGCHANWFGPACQYERANFTASGQAWLTDYSDTTCNNGPSQSVTVNLNTAIPLTWVRVVLNDAAYPNQIQLKYNSPLQSCTDFSTAKVDEVTLDIYCPTDTTVNQITLSGLGVTKLCALYISGGRNVALKQPTQQSKRYNAPSNNFFLAEYAVDGHVGDGSVDSTTLTCTHTDVNPSPDWWTVNFTQAVEIIRFLIFNRNDAGNNNVRLIGFTLTAQPESSSAATPYTYTDPQTTAQASYLIVPSSKISFPVSQVRVEAGPASQVLTLCEVYVFGENRCPPNRFGLSCERQCNCASGGSCFVHNGGCPDGCATDYAGEDCYDCAVGKYGADCNQDCSVHCGGDNSCDRDTGFCIQECDPGYTGDKCLLECSVGSYGAGCNSRCSSDCAGSDNACHHITGVCDSCPPGKYWSDCSRFCNDNCAGPENACGQDTGNCECDTGHWGLKCQYDCDEKCAGQDHACHQDGGACMSCSPGFYGTDCSTECSVHCGGSNNTCNITDGDCFETCDPGYREPKCNMECAPGTYGAGCQEMCRTEHCAGDINSCNHVNGTCSFGCAPGYQGKLCNQVCPRGLYGENCKNTCSEHCAGPDNACSSTDGACDQGCEPGYFPPMCVQKCPRGRYGPECTQKCSVYCAGPTKKCDFKTGICYQGCDVGYQPPTCHHECPAGAFGQDCKMTCSVHCAGSDIDCNKTDGSCDIGCKPGYQGRFCSEVCLRGKYGPGCFQNCSVKCAGQDRSCHHVDGLCYFGCVDDDDSPICRGTALQQSGESGESGFIIWGISVTIVAVVAIIVIGILAWRLFKCAKERSSTSKNNGIVEEGTQRPGQQGIPNINRTNQKYDTAQVGPEDVNLYNESFDHYDNPLDLMRRTGDYETPQPVAITDSNQDYVEADNVSAVRRTAESSGYVNTQ